MLGEIVEEYVKGLPRSLSPFDDFLSFNKMVEAKIKSLFGEVSSSSRFLSS